MDDKQHYDKIKRIIRNLKKAEIRARFGNVAPENKHIYSKLIWSKFFEIKHPYKGRAKYSLDQLVNMDKESLNRVIEEFYSEVFYQFYNDNYISGKAGFNPELLKKLGLKADASIDDIKKRFRELAKKLHPDTGGGHGEFVELNEVYQKLRE